MTISSISSHMFESSSGVLYTFSQMIDYFGVPSKGSKAILTKLQETAKMVAKGALAHSCDFEGDGQYFRKSVNGLPYPVFQNHEGRNFAIIKYFRRKDAYSLKKMRPFEVREGRGCSRSIKVTWKEPFAEGAFRRLYIAVELNFKKCPKKELKQRPVYTWGRTCIPSKPLMGEAEALRMEPIFYQRLSGDHSVRYFGHCLYNISEEDKIKAERVGMLMEFCPLTLEQSVENKEFAAYSFEEMCDFIESLLKLAELLKTQNILHCDIKTNNILLDILRRPKLCDYNLSFDFSNKPPFQVGRGTMIYLSPEECRAVLAILSQRSKEDLTSLKQFSIELGQKVFCTKIDIYKLGLVLYEICFGTLPFEGIHVFSSVKTIMKKLKSRNKEIISSLERMTSQNAKHCEFVPLIRGMLDIEPDTRYDVADCFSMLETIKSLGGST